MAEKTLECADANSVLRAIEQDWRTEHDPIGTRDIYQHLASLLNHRGFVIDAQDGLMVLEHCRRRKLPVVDVLEELDARVRKAGYCGGPLSAADLAENSMEVFAFFDSVRFGSFSCVRPDIQAALQQPSP